MTRVVADPGRSLGSVGPGLFGGFVEHLGRCVYGGLYEEREKGPEPVCLVEGGDDHSDHARTSLTARHGRSCRKPSSSRSNSSCRREFGGALALEAIPCRLNSSRPISTSRPRASGK